MASQDLGHLTSYHHAHLNFRAILKTKITSGRLNKKFLLCHQGYYCKQ